MSYIQENLTYFLECGVWMKYTDNSVARGSKQYACMSTTQLAIWPVGTVMISRHGTHMQPP